LKSKLIDDVKFELKSVNKSKLKDTSFVSPPMYAFKFSGRVVLRSAKGLKVCKKLIIAQKFPLGFICPKLETAKIVVVAPADPSAPFSKESSKGPTEYFCEVLSSALLSSALLEDSLSQVEDSPLCVHV
jgi:hypothetical protein